MAQLYILYCNNCSFKKLTDGSDFVNYVEVTTCVSCAGGRKFKCPKCGYLMKASKAGVSTKTKQQLALEKLRKQQEEKLKKEKQDQEKRLKEKRRKNGDL